MKQYKVASAITLTSGRVALDKKQAEAHSYAIKETRKKGVYEVVAPTSFKTGEVIGLDDDLPKVLAVCLKDPLEEDDSNAGSDGVGAKTETDGDTGSEGDEAPTA